MPKDTQDQRRHKGAALEIVYLPVHMYSRDPRHNSLCPKVRSKWHERSKTLTRNIKMLRSLTSIANTVPKKANIAPCP